VAENAKPQDLSDVKKDIEELRSDIAALGKDMKTLVRNGAAKRAASSAADTLQERAEAALASVAEQGRNAAQSVEKNVKGRPLESLLVAFGVGVLIGQLVRK